MRDKKVAFDTNILFYAIDNRDQAKHRFARNLLAEADPFGTVILLQTLGELLHSVARKRPTLLATARTIAEQLTTAFPVAEASLVDFYAAITAQQTHGLPFWDAMLWSTAKRNGCTLLLTEDLQDGRTLEGVTFINPFPLTEREVRGLLS